MTRMSRTTIMADEALLDELREIAKQEGVSLGQVIRQALEWRARTRRRLPSFIGKLPPSSGETTRPQVLDARDDEELIKAYVLEKHARR